MTTLTKNSHTALSITGARQGKSREKSFEKLSLESLQNSRC